jgi:hypothetical protein
MAQRYTERGKDEPQAETRRKGTGKPGFSRGGGGREKNYRVGVPFHGQVPYKSHIQIFVLKQRCVTHSSVERFSVDPRGCCFDL